MLQTRFVWAARGLPFDEEDILDLECREEGEPHARLIVRSRIWGNKAGDKDDVKVRMLQAALEAVGKLPPEGNWTLGGKGLKQVEIGP